MRLVTILVWVLPTLVLGLELGHAETRSCRNSWRLSADADKERRAPTEKTCSRSARLPQMLVVPPGRFMMGSPETEESHL